MNTAQTTTNISGVDAPATTRKRYAVDEIDITDIKNTMADFQDQAMCLAQAIERELMPKYGEDSPHFSAWRLCQLLTAHLECGHMQRAVQDFLRAEPLTDGSGVQHE